MSLRDPLRRVAAGDPEGAALSDGRRRWSWSRLDVAADALAARLAAAGVRPEERVALLLPPGPEAVLAVHAVPRAGAVLAPLDPKWSPPELTAALAALEPAALVVAEDAAAPEGAGSAPPALRLSPADLDGARAPVPPPECGPPEVFAVLWTSGTGGRPRGVELTRGNLEANAAAARERLGLRPDDVWYASLRPAHVGGLALIHRAAVVGCAVFAGGGFDAAVLDRLIDDGAVTHASLVPAMLDRLLERRGARAAPATLRCLLLGGAATPRPLVARAVGLGFPIALTYGLTEASSQVATAPAEDVRAAIESGDPLPGAEPLPGVEIRVSAGGEILVRGPTVARRFLHSRPAGDPIDGPAGREADRVVAPDGWLHTGDAGRLDDAGRLVVTGRLSDRIVTGGVNVHPAEVEAVVHAHPAVREAAALGLPDPRWGERVAVAAVLHAGASLTVDELLDFARPRLSPPRRPRALLLLDALPRNAAGKVDRERLRGLDWPGPGSTHRRGA